MSRIVAPARALWLLGAALASAGWWACKSELTINSPTLGSSDAAVPMDGPPPADAGLLPADAGPVDAAPEAAATAAPLDPLTAQSLKDALGKRAKKQAAGMKPMGEMFGAVLTEGSEFEGPPLTINPQQCVTVLAQGGLGVTEVDIRLAGKSLIQGAQGTPLAVDNTTGPEAAVAPCYKNVLMIAIPATVTIKATRGSGGVGAQIFLK
jgi:hypothetical protein